MTTKLLTDVLNSVSDAAVQKKIVELSRELSKKPLKDADITQVAKKFGLVKEETHLDDPVDLLGQGKMNSMLDELADELMLPKDPSPATQSLKIAPVSGELIPREWKEFGVAVELDSGIWSNDIPAICEYPTATLRIAPKDVPEGPSPLEILAVVIVAEDAFYQNITLQEFVEKQKNSAAQVMPFPGMEPKVKSEGPKKLGVWQYEIVFDMSVPSPYGGVMELVMHQLAAMSDGRISYLCQWTGPKPLYNEWKPKFFGFAEKVTFTDVPNLAPVNSLQYYSESQKLSITTPQYWMVVGEDRKSSEDFNVVLRMETMMIEEKRDLVEFKVSTNDKSGEDLAKTLDPSDLKTEGEVSTFTYSNSVKQSCVGVVKGKYLLTAEPKEAKAKSSSTETSILVECINTVQSTDSVGAPGSQITLNCDRMKMQLPGRKNMRAIEHRFGTPSVSCAFDITQEEGPTLMIAYAEEGKDLTLEGWWDKCKEDLGKQQSKILTQEYGEISGLKAMTVISKSSGQPHPFMPFQMPSEQIIYNSIVKRGEDTIVFQIECSPELWKTYEKEVKDLLSAVKLE